ncbi:hypothetical protein [Nocardia macrotermitis]|uniref:Uncharacterized protein n=1 Tax=Nocardia macrotermitis TaxID=2585198 RepID=A0A7K0D9T7_9NOCA|nr:hypothetical protein [Nocardia macrotermitis]MQY22092.1 hypothetical protein [Nocardia macrotermitis]
MRNVIVLVVGVALLALGAQGGIRLVIDHSNAGMLGWLPGGFGVRLVCYVIMAAVGIYLANWGTQRSDRTRSDE